MKLLIDDANLDSIKKLYEYYKIDGVTTNPSILSKEEVSPIISLSKIRNFIGDDQLHIQVLSQFASDMVKEARLITNKFGDNTYIKVPTNDEGLKAMKQLTKEGVKVTATAIYSPLQGYLAMKSGADYLAIYINRIDDLGYDGIEVAKSIKNIKESYNYDSKILAASFKNSNQVLKLLQLGIDAATCSPSVIEKFIADQNVDEAIKDFSSDFKKLGSDTMIDYLRED
ncbi:MAG: transaldolase family protein [Tissierellia bacterium]|nr:transaldolase family protein [Tissierellia bacterium]